MADPSLIALGTIWLADKIAGHLVTKALEEISLDSSQLKARGGIIESSKITLRRIQDYNRTKLINKQEEFRTYLLKYYQGQKNTLLYSDNIRIPYAHEMTFFPGIDDYVNPANIVSTIDVKFSLDKSISIAGFKKAAREYRTGFLNDKEPFPGSTVRISARHGNSFTLQESDYIDQFSSCQKEIIDVELLRIIDYNNLKTSPSVNINTSQRKLNSHHGELVDFENSSLANSIGVAATVVTSDGFLVLPRRNKNVHFNSNLEGCSVSGSLEWANEFRGEGTLISGCKEQILGKEMAQELFLNKDNSTLIELSLAREFERGGKPQFFFHIWSDLRKDQIDNHWRSKRKDQNEYFHLSFIRLSMPGSSIGWEKAVEQMKDRIAALLIDDNTLSIDGRTIALSEEVRANLYYLGIYLSHEKIKCFPIHWRD